MRRLPVIVVGLLVTASVAAVVFVLVVPQMHRLESVSPSNNVMVRGLPFQGTAPSPLDGTLRLYIDEDKWQTDIPFNRQLEIVWSQFEDPSVETFSIQSEDSTMMIWRVDGGAPVCIRGSEHLVDDPYLRPGDGARKAVPGDQ